MTAFQSLSWPDVNMLAGTLSRMEVSVVATDLAGRVKVWNLGAEQLFGWTSSEVLGTNVFDAVLLPTERPLVQDLMGTVAAGGVWEGDAVARTRAATPLDLHVVVAPVFDAAGEVDGVVGISSLALRSAHTAIVEIAELMELQRIGVQAVEGERKRIARELHDELGQVLTALRTEVLWLHARSDGPVAESADRVAASVASALDSLRRIVDELHPHLLEQLGVCAAVEAMAGAFQQRIGVGVEVTIDHEGLGWIQHDVEMAVFRVTQECLTNIERHAAGVSHVMVEMVHETPDPGTPGDFVLRITNDGTPYNGARGFGIRSMMDRATSVGGHVAMVATRSGAMVEMRVPAVFAFTDRPAGSGAAAH